MPTSQTKLEAADIGAACRAYCGAPADADCKLVANVKDGNVLEVVVVVSTVTPSDNSTTPPTSGQTVTHTL